MNSTLFGSGILWLYGAGSILLSLPPAHARSLVPPPGYYAEVQYSQKKARPCLPVPKPYTGKLEFPSKYEGSDSARDDLNPKAYAKYREATADINKMEKEVSAMVESYLHNGHDETLQCTLDWLARWSQAGALKGEAANHTGKSVRKWALASLASAYLRLKFSATQPLQSEPEKSRQIEAWFSDLGKIVVDDWKDQPLDKVNNHEYWAAWAVMATAVAVNRRDFFDWPVKEYRVAATQVDVEGYLPNELKRDTRALAYHNYALGPLTMIAAFAKANGVDVTHEGNDALQRLATRVLQGVDQPRIFEDKTGKKQLLDQLEGSSKFAWLEPYCSMFMCQGAVTKRMASLRPMKTYRLGGNLTELFAPARHQTGQPVSDNSAGIATHL